MASRVMPMYSVIIIWALWIGWILFADKETGLSASCPVLESRVGDCVTNRYYSYEQRRFAEGECWDAAGGLLRRGLLNRHNRLRAVWVDTSDMDMVV